MQHRFSIADLTHHFTVAADAQRGFAADCGNDRLAAQFTRQALDASTMANVFVEVDNRSAPAKIYLDGDQLVVEVA